MRKSMHCVPNKTSSLRLPRASDEFINDRSVDMKNIMYVRCCAFTFIPAGGGDFPPDGWVTRPPSSHTFHFPPACRCRHLQSASASSVTFLTLVIPSTRRTALDDRAFPLTAAFIHHCSSMRLVCCWAPTGREMLTENAANYTVLQETVYQPAKRAFRCSAPAVWNSLPKTVLSSDCVCSF